MVALLVLLIVCIIVLILFYIKKTITSQFNSPDWLNMENLQSEKPYLDNSEFDYGHNVQYNNNIEG